MPAPHLDTCCFPKLSSNPNKDSYGTVTGPNIGHGDTVTIRSKNTTKIWVGQVTTLISGNSWNVVVRRAQEKENRASETVGVTVTNSTTGDSNEVPQDSEIVP